VQCDIYKIYKRNIMEGATSFCLEGYVFDDLQCFKQNVRNAELLMGAAYAKIFSGLLKKVA
jgi:hypothetical protein